MPIAKRRKYLFTDRAAAEAECARQGTLAARYRLALDAAINGEIIWIRGGCYDAGIVGKERCDGGVVLVTFHGRNLDQKPSTTVYDPDEIRDWHKSLWNPSNSDERELRDLLGRVLQD